MGSESELLIASSSIVTSIPLTRAVAADVGDDDDDDEGELEEEEGE